eukprot:1161265-Pelagomonas_calceolata.AAC.12
MGSAGPTAATESRRCFGESTGGLPGAAAASSAAWGAQGKKAAAESGTPCGEGEGGGGNREQERQLAIASSSAWGAQGQGKCCAGRHVRLKEAWHRQGCGEQRGAAVRSTYRVRGSKNNQSLVNFIL